MPASQQLRDLVVRRAGNRCEYCQVSQDADPVFRYPVDRIISGQHGGRYTSENTALACHHCNRKKGPNIASVDPQQPEVVVPLYHPRNEQWTDHFALSGAEIKGITAAGRATVQLLELNTEAKMRLRILD